MNVLETSRLTLREFTTDDASFLFTLVNSPGWLQYIGDRGVRNLEDAKNYINSRMISSYKTFGFGFYVVSLKDGTPIGMCGLVKRETLDDVDIGFALLPEYAGKGYAVEAALPIVTYAKAQLKLKRLVAITNVDNTNSIRLLEKIGMEFEKLITFNGNELKLFAMNLEYE